MYITKSNFLNAQWTLRRLILKIIFLNDQMMWGNNSLNEHTIHLVQYTAHGKCVTEKKKRADKQTEIGSTSLMILKNSKAIREAKIKYSW